MLQQTTVGTVLNHFEKFLYLYPTLGALAQATEEEVCVAWKGLGYYRRARNLLKAAQCIVQKHGSRIPTEYNQLIEIPGIGAYTASALVAIGKNQRALCVDANIERVTARLFALGAEKGSKLQREIKTQFDTRKIYQNFDRYSPRELNEALMDLGRVLCRAKRADCTLCPIRSNCRGKHAPLSFPLSANKIEQSFELSLIRYIVKRKNQVLVYQKSKNHWLADQYELPTFIWKSEDPLLKQYPQWGRKEIRPLGTLKTTITKYKITNYIVEASEQEARKVYQKYARLTYKDISSRENLSNTTFKILQHLLKKPSRE